MAQLRKLCEFGVRAKAEVACRRMCEFGVRAKAEVACRRRFCDRHAIGGDIIHRVRTAVVRTGV